MDELDGVPLSRAEQAFALRLSELFARVGAAHPERGVRTLIRRARRAVAAGVTQDDALAAEYAGAERRTLRRLELAARSACRRT